MVSGVPGGGAGVGVYVEGKDDSEVVVGVYKLRRLMRRGSVLFL
jgi:hypothetical protein